MVDYTILKAELSLPKYASMTHEEASMSLNDKTIPADRDEVPSIEILSAIKPTSYPSDVRMQAYLSALLSQESVPLRSPNIRAAMRAIFAGQLETLNALAALQQENISRAQELGLGLLKPGHIRAARSM